MAPQIVPFTFGDEPANSGESMSATCSVSKGDQPLEISWAFNGVPLNDNSDVTISTSKRLSVLQIEAVAARHAGEYTCTAANRAGAVSRAVTLTVNGKFSRESLTYTFFS